MTKIKYELVPSEEQEPNESKKPLNWIVKILFVVLALFTLVIYTLSGANNPLKNNADPFSPWKSMRLLAGSGWTNNPGDLSSPLNVKHTTRSLSTEKQTESTEAIYNKLTDTESTTEDQTEITTVDHTDEVVESSTSSPATGAPKTETLYALEGNGKKYFVHSPQCQMSHPNPFASNIQHIYKKHSYIVCDKSRDMITVNYNVTDSTYRLHKNENSTCCFKQILRAGTSANADHKYK